MTEDSESSLPTNSESPELSVAPSEAPKQISLDDMTSSHMMLKSFYAAVREGHFEGSLSRDIALGLDFLERMINTSQQQLDWAKKMAKDSIKNAGGKITDHGNQAAS